MHTEVILMNEAARAFAIGLFRSIDEASQSTYLCTLYIQRMHIKIVSASFLESAVHNIIFGKKKKDRLMKEAFVNLYLCANAIRKSRIAEKNVSAILI